MKHLALIAVMAMASGCESDHRQKTLDDQILALDQQILDNNKVILQLTHVQVCLQIKDNLAALGAYKEEFGTLDAWQERTLWDEKTQLMKECPHE